jgi:hypothetical protein
LAVQLSATDTLAAGPNRTSDDIGEAVIARVQGHTGPRTPCASCGATQRLSGYADETIRNNWYGYAAERGDGPDARSACWHVLVPMLLEPNVTELVIERLAGSEARDERDIGDALRKADTVRTLGYRHETHRAEPILWLTDAVAWATGAKGDWQRRIGLIFDR